MALRALAALAACAAARGQPVKAGDPEYPTTLTGIEPAEALMSPAFSPLQSQYRIDVSHGRAEVVHVGLLLDFSLYEPRFCPKITVDGEVLDYSPIRGASVAIALGRHIGPVEKRVVIRVADPKPKEASWMHFMDKENAHEYVLNVVKPPVTSELISASSIEVQDADTGEALLGKRPFDPQAPAAGTYTYTAPASTKRVLVRASCPQERGVTQRVDGDAVKAGTAKVVDMSRVYQERIHVRCEYTDRQWSSTAVQNTYVLDIHKHVDLRSDKVVSAELMALPEFGDCRAVRETDPTVQAHHFKVKQAFGELVAQTAFVCRADRSTSLFVATFSSADGAEPQAELQNTDTREMLKMQNAIPTPVAMSKERQFYALKVEAGDLTVVYPVVMLWPGRCGSLACPEDQAMKTEDPFNAKAHMCAAEKCTAKDEGTCCAPRAMCNTYSIGCPVGKDLRQDAASIRCTGITCTKEADEALCCGSATTTSVTRTATSTTETRTATSTAPTTTGTRTRSSTRTATSSTATPTTTETATETTTLGDHPLYCIEPNTVYLPLDMEGRGSVVVEDSVACQELCGLTPGCETFAFWTRGRHCHLQGANTTKQLFGFGFDSGPARCTPEHTVTTTTTDPVPMNERCFQEGLSWSPLLGPTLEVDMSKDEATSYCQQFCAQTGGCAHFQLDRFTGLCSVAGVAAEPLPGLPSTLSGPPVCEPFYNELSDFITGKGSVEASGESPFEAANRLFGPARARQSQQNKHQQQTPAPNLNCVEEGVLWVPYIDQQPAKGEDRDEILAACQASCASTPRCHRFTVSFMDKSCRLSDSSAMHLSAVGIVSGPPVCQDAAGYGDLAILRRYGSGAERPARRAGLGASWRASLAARSGALVMVGGGVVAVALLAGLWRSGRQEGVHRQLFLVQQEDEIE